MKENRKWILTIVLFLACVLGLPVTSRAATSSNVKITVDQTMYYCAKGQKFKIVATIDSGDTYEEGSHKYIGYLAFYSNGWQEIKNWYVDGGVTEATITLNSNDFTSFYQNSPLMFVVSLFPKDNFATGGSLYDCMFNVSFIPEYYTVKYDANGGNCNTPSGKAIYNTAYGELPVPERTGYTFDGWYTEKSDGTKVTESTVVSRMQDHTLYAHWKANSYYIRLDATGGSQNILGMSCKYGSTYAALLNSVKLGAPAGKTFAGWYTSAEGGTEITAESVISIAMDHTLYAHWKWNYYTITYHANGGSGAPESQTKVYNQSIVLSSVSPIRENYIFSGWARKSDSQSIDYKPGATYSLNEDVTLYAIWTKKQPETKPSTPATEPTIPSTPTTEPSQPSTNPSAPSAKPSQPSATPPADAGNVPVVQPSNDGSKTITRKYKKNQKFSLGIKVTGKATYKTSNKKVVVVDKKGKAQIKGYGKATVTITQKGKKTQKVSVVIIPTSVSVSAKSQKAGKLLISWKRNSTVNGYQIQYSKEREFPSGDTRTGTAKSNKLTKTTVSLNRGTIYYVRVRTYKNASGGKVYSAWSKVKKVRIK